MKKSVKIFLSCLSLFSVGNLTACSCGGSGDKEDSIKLTVWVSEADRAFAGQVVEAFKAKQPDKTISS